MIVVVPMAGRGSRFSKTGVQTPKPLIQVAARPMVEWALESLVGLTYSQIIFVILQEHDASFGVSNLLTTIAGDKCKIVPIDRVTEGQLCTVMAAKKWILPEDDLLIASSDTYVRSNLAQDIAERSDDCHGIISVACMPGDHWSFVRTNAEGSVVAVAEKERISDMASTGLYYFSKGHEFISAAKEIIENHEKSAGEYYVMPVYQKYIYRNLDVRISLASEMLDMGTPGAAHQSAEVLSKSYIY